MQERRYADLKMDRFIARIYHYSMVGLAVISSSAIASSIPLIALKALPQWADLALAVGGVLIAPGSIHEAPVTKDWRDQAEEAVAKFETMYNINSNDNSKAA